MLYIIIICKGLGSQTFQKLFLLSSTQNMVLNAATTFGNNKEDKMVLPYCNCNPY